MFIIPARPTRQRGIFNALSIPTRPTRKRGILWSLSIPHRPTRERGILFLSFLQKANAKVQAADKPEPSLADASGGEEKWNKSLATASGGEHLNFNQ